MIEDVSLQSQRCDQPAQGPTTEGSVIGEASRERCSCNGPTGELNIAVEPAKQSMHAIQPSAKRRYRVKKKRETTGELNISVESVTQSMDAIQPRAKRRYRVKKRRETTRITTGNATKEKIQRKRKRAACREDNTVCGKKQLCRTWTPNLREQNGKSSEDPEIRQNLEQANELIALNTKMFSAPSTPQHEEVWDTGKIWESDGHPQSGDTSIVSEEKIMPENSGEADLVQNTLVEVQLSALVVFDVLFNSLCRTVMVKFTRRNAV